MLKSTTVRVLLGLLLGAVIGVALAMRSPDLGAQAAELVQPIGRLWLNALQMTVVPLVASLIVIGVSTASDAASSGRIARRAIVVFIVLLSAGAAFAVVITPMLLSFAPHDPTLLEILRTSTPAAGAAPPARFADWVAAIVPSNALAAAAQSAMLPLVVFALFFGFALTRVERERRIRVVDLLQTLTDTMIVIVRWVLWAAPVGVFALVLAVCARAGVGVLSALGYYVLLQCLVYVGATLLLYVIALVAGGERLSRFASGVLPAQVIAASTQSSLASLPAMLESAESRLRYPRVVSALVLPLAVSLFRMTSPIQYLNAAMFIAWIYGVELSPAQLAAGAALAVVISLGSVGLPGQVSFMATTMPVAQSMALPVEPLGLLLAVDTIPDVFATVGNVTGDLTATAIVAKRTQGERVEAAARSATEDASVERAG